MTRPSGAVLWSAGEAAGSALLSVTSAFVVARLIGPAAMGAGAAVVSVHVLLWVGVNALFADALVQRARLDEEAAASAFWASCVVGLAAALLQVALGRALAVAMEDPLLFRMSVPLACALPLVGAAGPVQGRLVRDRRYALLAWRTLVGQGAGTITGVGCALCGAGAWAVAAQQATTSAIGAAALLLGAGWRPAPVWQWRAVRDMLAIGGPLTASTLLQHGRYRLFALLIGAISGAAALGQVHVAFRLVDTVRDLSCTALWRLMLPSMAQRQGDLAALRANVDRWLAASAPPLLALCVALLVCVEPLTRLLLGPAWREAGAAALPLAGLAAWLFLAFPAGVALIARGEPGFALRANLASLAALLAVVMVLHPATARQAVWLWLGAQVLVTPYLLRAAARMLQTRSGRLLRAGIPGLVLAGTAALAALAAPPFVGSPAALIAERMLILGAVYGIAAMLVYWKAWVAAPEEWDSPLRPRLPARGEGRRRYGLPIPATGPRSFSAGSRAAQGRRHGSAARSSQNAGPPPG